MLWPGLFYFPFSKLNFCIISEFILLLLLVFFFFFFTFSLQTFWKKKMYFIKQCQLIFTTHTKQIQTQSPAAFSRASFLRCAVQSTENSAKWVEIWFNNEFQVKHQLHIMFGSVCKTQNVIIKVTCHFCLYIFFQRLKNKLVLIILIHFIFNFYMNRILFSLRFTYY